MSFFDSITLALRNIGSNKMRAFLTMLGIVIGVASVISLMSIGQGTQASITQQIEGIGTNLLMIYPGQASTQGVRAEGGSATLTLDDAKALNDPDLAPDVVLVAPSSQTMAQIVAGSNNSRTSVTGVTPEYQYVRNWELMSGEFIAAYHVEGRSLVAILGNSTAQTLFGDADPVGQSIKVQQIQFKVIGVLKAKGGTGFGSADDVVMVPITTLISRLQTQRGTGGQQRVSNVNVMVSSTDRIDAARDQISEILRTRHRVAAGSEDFNVLSQQDMISTLSSVTTVMTIFLGAIAGISLLVGGIGIMNIMLVTVTERTREIGIRKAIGAKAKDILLQFLIESATLSFGGAIVGYTLGLLLSNTMNGLSLGGTVVHTSITPPINALAMGVAVAIGLFFGIYPARRAARMDPIVALRYE